MNNNTLFSIFRQIIGKPWAIDVREAYFQAPLILQMLADHSLATAFFSQLNERFILDQSALSAKISAAQPDSFVNYPQILRDENPVESTPENSTAVIPVSGPLTKYGGLCSYGMNDMAAWVNHAAGNPKIKNILIVLDTPGGTVDGTMKLADTIKKVQKPTVALVDGLCASAGYWIASACDSIVALNKMCEIGSIGVASYFSDVRKKLIADGWTFHDINSTLSPDKSRTFLEALKGNYEPIQTEALDPAARKFIYTIKKNRPKTAASVKAWSTGKVFYAADALNLGLIDRIGGIDACINELNKNSSLTKTSFTMKNLSHLTLLMAAIGVEALESTDDGIFLMEEQLDQIESALLENQNTINELHAHIANANTQAEQTASALAETTRQLEAVQQTCNKNALALSQATENIASVNAELEKSRQEYAAALTEIDVLKERLPAADNGNNHTSTDFDDAPENASVDPDAKKIFSARPK